MQVARLDGNSTAITNGEVHYLTVEAGTYTEAEHGVKMEAVKYLSTVTDRKNSWNGVLQNYSNSYTTPVVVGQVQTANDSAWSVFWASKFSVVNPPSSSTLRVGKHVGDDPNQTRVDETVSYIVVEARTGSIGGMSYTAGVGSDSIEGIDNSPPDSYTLSRLATAETAVVSSAGMDGNEGGWPVLYGSNPVTSSALQLAIDEEQLSDSERTHTTEQVSYIVFGTLSP